MKLQTLFSKGSKGETRQWTMIIDGDSFYVESGVVGGKLTITKPNKCEGKNIGKKNETSPESQAEAEGLSKWEKQQRSGGYWLSIDDIDKKRHFEPMLAKKFIDYRDKIDFTKGVLVQDKLNGTRAIISKDGAFSRTGEEYFCVDHIKDELKPYFDQNPNIILDGELFSYEHKNKLNEITSLVSVNRKAKDVSEEDVEKSKKIVKFYIYDYYLPESKATLIERTKYLHNYEFFSTLKYSKILTYLIVYSEDSVMHLLKESKNKKEEGIMIKILDGFYEQKRSANLLKLKNFEDDEFEVLDVLEGSGNWAGCAKMVRCLLPDGQTFDSNLRGTQENNAQVLREKSKYIGKKVTVRYQEKSPYGIPLIPYCEILIVRDYE